MISLNLVSVLNKICCCGSGTPRTLRRASIRSSCSCSSCGSSASVVFRVGSGFSLFLLEGGSCYRVLWGFIGLQNRCFKSELAVAKNTKTSQKLASGMLPVLRIRKPGVLLLRPAVKGFPPDWGAGNHKANLVPEWHVQAVDDWNPVVWPAAA